MEGTFASPVLLSTRLGRQQAQGFVLSIGACFVRIDRVVATRVLLWRWEWGRRWKVTAEKQRLRKCGTRWFDQNGYGVWSQPSDPETRQPTSKPFANEVQLQTSSVWWAKSTTTLHEADETGWTYDIREIKVSFLYWRGGRRLWRWATLNRRP